VIWQQRHALSSYFIFYPFDCHVTRISLFRMALCYEEHVTNTDFDFDAHLVMHSLLCVCGRQGADGGQATDAVLECVRGLPPAGHARIRA